MTIEDIQRRHRWLTAPFNAVSNVLTPQRWAGAGNRVAAALGRTLVPDTTGTAQRLIRVTAPVRRLRERLLERRPALRAADWKIRQAFWCLVWEGVIVGVRTPRKAPVPHDEVPIDLLTAPQTYPDFAAPTLVVPAGVPDAESSLISNISVQLLQLLQDVYPIVTSHQSPASADPVQRFRDAYPGIYRITRKAPVWHPDLVLASEKGNLLGALATGGPFAKLLTRASDTGGYAIDLRHISDYPVREGLCLLGNRILLDPDGSGGLSVTGVEYGDELYAPGEARWEMVERIALAALVTHVTVWRQGMEYHVGGLACVPVLTHNLLPPDHPLRRLLAPHMSMTMLTNYSTHLTLRRTGFDVQGFSFPYDTLLRYYDDGAARFDIRRLDVAGDAAARGIANDIDYPWLPQAVRYWGLFGDYVSAYLDHAYPSEADLEADRAAHLWFEALDRTVVGGLRHYVAHLDKANLVQLCTLLIYSHSLGHTENSLFNYAVFLPTSVHSDGSQQTVGEVQCTVNFQYLVTARTTLLLDDISHLALDEGAARIMRGLRESLLVLQAEMEQHQSRYWHLYPAELEASVSA